MLRFIWFHSRCPGRHKSPDDAGGDQFHHSNKCIWQTRRIKMIGADTKHKTSPSGLIDPSSRAWGKLQRQSNADALCRPKAQSSRTWSRGCGHWWRKKGQQYAKKHMCAQCVLAIYRCHSSSSETVRCRKFAANARIGSGEVERRVADQRSKVQDMRAEDNTTEEFTFRWAVFVFLSSVTYSWVDWNGSLKTCLARTIKTTFQSILILEWFVIDINLPASFHVRP